MESLILYQKQWNPLLSNEKSIIFSVIPCYTLGRGNLRGLYPLLPKRFKLLILFCALEL